MITYTKLKSGDWGIRSASPFREGDTIAVTLKSGGTKAAEVGNKVWSGNGVYLYAIGGRTNGSSRPSYTRRGSGAGAAAPVPGYSSYCTDRPGCRCFDCQ